MKKKIIFVPLFILICIIISISVFSRTNHDSKKTELYSLTGSNEFITVNNGFIVVAPDVEKFIGGNLTFINKITNANDISTRFYYIEDGEKVVLNDNIFISPDKEIDTQDTGSISSTQLFYGNDLELIRDSLFFSVRGTFSNGETFEYEIKLDVKKIY